MVALALLNLGPSELALILLLLLLLFGADRLPQLARSLGRFKGELERARKEVERAMLPPKSEEDQALEEQLAFERAREEHMKRQDVEFVQLEAAAKELGIESAGLDKEGLRKAIAAKVDGDTA